MSAIDSYLALRRWTVAAVLAVPFLIGVAALRGLTVALPIFHSSDELNYQYPTILRFAKQLPFPDLANYKAAQTPLFHVLMAYAGKLTGYELWRLRLVEVLISYALALAVYVLLRRSLALPRVPALALTLLFVLSPYVYGTSFRLMTDNLALLFSVLTIERLERFRESDRLSTLAVASACLAAAMLTRQSTAFLLPVAGLYALRSGRSTGRRLLALIGVGVAAVPVGLLFLTWHGLVPPGGDPSSCGLCPTGRAGSRASQGGLVAQTPELMLATIGLYGGVLFAPLALARLRSGRGWPAGVAREPLIGGAAGALLLLVLPASPGTHAAGLIWNVAGRFPTIDGTSIVFWALVPLAGAVLGARLRVAPRPWLVLVFLGCFLIAALAIRYPWQKYVDPFALLALLFTVRRDEFSSPVQLAGAGVLAVAFIAYTLSFSAHANSVQPHTLSRSRSTAARIPFTNAGASAPQKRFAVSTASSIAPSAGIGCSPGTAAGCSSSSSPTRRIERSTGAIRSSDQPSA